WPGRSARRPRPLPDQHAIPVFLVAPWFLRLKAERRVGRRVSSSGSPLVARAAAPGSCRGEPSVRQFEREEGVDRHRPADRVDGLWHEATPLIVDETELREYHRAPLRSEHAAAMGRDVVDLAPEKSIAEGDDVAIGVPKDVHGMRYW